MGMREQGRDPARAGPAGLGPMAQCFPACPCFVFFKRKCSPQLYLLKPGSQCRPRATVGIPKIVSRQGLQILQLAAGNRKTGKQTNKTAKVKCHAFQCHSDE